MIRSRAWEGYVFIYRMKMAMVILMKVVVRNIRTLKNSFILIRLETELLLKLSVTKMEYREACFPLNAV